MPHYTRTQSYFIVFGVYLLSGAAALAVYNALMLPNMLLGFFIADVAATLIVWLGGTVFKNASVYDPYWSVAPIVMLSLWLATRGAPYTLLDALSLCVILIWGIRLTVNWMLGWKGLGGQDWRYSLFQRKYTRYFALINLIGICLMPTVLVFLGMVPLLLGTGLRGSISPLSIIGFCVCLLAALLEVLGDRQLRKFRKSNPTDQVCSAGLWRYTRHPNYLGEILFWWGVFILGTGTMPFRPSLLIGPVMITLLFILISIPMMEKHLIQNRPEYEAYKARVPALLPMPGKKAPVSRSRRRMPDVNR